MKALFCLFLSLFLSAAVFADFRPSDLLVWDGWTVSDGTRAHLYYLRYRGPGSVSPAGTEDILGHAVSEDLFRWTELSGCLAPGEKGTADDMQPWTGCTVLKDGKYYLFYTMRSSLDGATKQKIGLALSEDGQNFKRYPDNPVIVPDGRWYIDDYSVCRSIDCRDLTVVKYKDFYIGYFVTRKKGTGAVKTNCIGCAKSADLVHWEQLPPVFSSERYSCTECPDVFEQNGKWYLTMATANAYGSIAEFSDKNIIKGEIYAVSDSPFGPFREPRKNVLLGDGGCFRTFVFRGQRYGIFCAATASRPFLVKAKGSDLWLEAPEELRKTETIRPETKSPARLLYPHPAWKFADGGFVNENGVFRGVSPSGYLACQIFGVPAEEFAVSCRLKIKGAGGGLVIRPRPESDTSIEDTCIYIDKKNSTLQISSMADMAHNVWNTRSISVKDNMILTAVHYEDKFDVYLDGKLMLHATWGLLPGKEAGIGLMADRGRIEGEFL